MKPSSDISKVMYTKEEIAERVAQLAKQISNDYKDKFPLLICILKGSVVFYTDLIRAMDIDVEMEFMAISSYGGGTTSSGEVRLLKDLDVSLNNRDVIVIEDIVDTGVTLSYLLKLLKARGASSVEVACLLSKEARRRAAISVKYIGFDIPDEFVIGYGLDFDEKYRGLDCVCVLDSKCYGN